MSGNVGGGQRVRRKIEAGKNVDLVADDGFLRQPLGDIRRDAAESLAASFIDAESDRVKLAEREMGDEVDRRMNEMSAALG